MSGTAPAEAVSLQLACPSPYGCALFSEQKSPQPMSTPLVAKFVTEVQMRGCGQFARPSACCCLGYLKGEISLRPGGQAPLGPLAGRDLLQLVSSLVLCFTTKWCTWGHRWWITGHQDLNGRQTFRPLECRISNQPFVYLFLMV